MLPPPSVPPLPPPPSPTIYISVSLQPCPYNDEERKENLYMYIHASKPTSPGWAKLPQSRTTEYLHRFAFNAAAAPECAAILLTLDWADYAQVSAAARKADYLCPNRVVSLETQDAIISMGRVIIGDQALVTVRCWHVMRQSLSNEGLYMCEVNQVLPFNSCPALNVVMSSRLL